MQSGGIFYLFEYSKRSVAIVECLVVVASGPVDFADGVVGFGDSPNLAIQAFNTAWYKKITPVDEIFSETKEALDNIKLL